MSTKAEQERVPCPNCNGTTEDYQWHDEECRECRGTDGWVTVAEAEQIRQHLNIQ